MSCYMVNFDLQALAAQLSLALGCRFTDVDAREFLQSVGAVEAQQGWLAADLRPLALIYSGPGGILS